MYPFQQPTFKKHQTYDIHETVRGVTNSIFGYQYDSFKTPKKKHNEEEEIINRMMSKF